MAVIIFVFFFNLGQNIVDRFKRVVIRISNVILKSIMKSAHQRMRIVLIIEQRFLVIFYFYFLLGFPRKFTFVLIIYFLNSRHYFHRFNHIFEQRNVLKHCKNDWLVVHHHTEDHSKFVGHQQVVIVLRRYHHPVDHFNDSE